MEGDSAPASGCGGYRRGVADAARLALELAEKCRSEEEFRSRLELARELIRMGYSVRDIRVVMGLGEG